MANATKFRSVLPREHVGRVAIFETPTEERPEDQGAYRTVILELDDYRDLGEPDTITVTIEPGDRLNED